MLNYCTNYRSAIIRLSSLIMLLTAIGLPIQVIAMGAMGDTKSDTMGGAVDVDQLSKEIINPVGPNWLINTYLNVTEKKGDITGKSRTNTEWLIQPVMPIPLDDKPMGLTLMNRPTLPIILDNSIPQTDALGNFTEFDNVSGIGDLMIMTAIGSMPKASFGMYMWGVVRH